jgi:hypothetical protein
MKTDAQVEVDAVESLISSTLQPQQIQHLQAALQADPALSEIVDALLVAATEFSGDGPVEGPGTGLSDDIPARLSDGEFVFSAKATAVIGVDVLQQMMEEAEAMADAPQTQQVAPKVADGQRATSLLERNPQTL